MSRKSHEAANEYVSRKIAEKMRDQQRRECRQVKNHQTNFAEEYGVMVEGDGGREHRGKHRRHI